MLHCVGLSAALLAPGGNIFDKTASRHTVSQVQQTERRVTFFRRSHGPVCYLIAAPLSYESVSYTQ